MCSHQSCGAGQRVWLPVKSDGASDPAPHPWCIKCGTVKNLSESRGKKMGYWMNVLSRVSRRNNISQVQKHLVSKALRAYDGFDDIYAITYDAQLRIFINIMKKYSNVDENAIYSVC